MKRVAEELAAQPEYPINQASEDAAATKAAYRLFDNERVAAGKIFSAHKVQTLQRMRDELVVLAIQDTSFFNFSKHKKTTGLGSIGDKEMGPKGLILHSTLAVTPRGLPLGVLLRAFMRTTQCKLVKHVLPLRVTSSYVNPHVAPSALLLVHNKMGSIVCVYQVP